MAAVGFKEYKDRQYTARKGISKFSNMIWSTVLTIAVIIGIIYVFKWTKPWREVVSTPTADETATKRP